MIENGRFERAAESYAVAFKVGAVGSILLGAYAVTGDTLVGLALLAVWLLSGLFVLPWLFLWYCDLESITGVL